MREAPARPTATQATRRRERLRRRQPTVERDIALANVDGRKNAPDGYAGGKVTGSTMARIGHPRRGPDRTKGRALTSTRWSRHR